MLNKKEFEIGPKGLLVLMSRVVDEYCVVAKAYYDMHVSGFPDLTEIFFQIQKKQVSFADQLEEKISDKELLVLFSTVKKEFVSLISLDNQFIDYLAAYVGLPPPKSKREKNKIKKQLETIIYNGNDHLSQGPIWVFNEDYRLLLKSNEIEFNSFIKLCNQLKKKIESISSL
jgi:hypothetical protein